ncbi:arginase family protein [Paenibacillus sp. An7]|uniref:arginase family protein n=1 Tax=Paenibacillus sp. An7 TaxID=2689577 RepID=UPI001359BC0C|nr:arginase family protein [Paenibacillus sp. An7]
MNPYYLMQRFDDSWVAADENFTQFYEVEHDSWNVERNTPLLQNIKPPLIPFFNFNPLLGQPKPNVYLLGIPNSGGTSVNDSPVSYFEESLRAESWKRTVYPAVVPPFTSGLFDIGMDRRLMQGVISQDLGTCEQDNLNCDRNSDSFSVGVNEVMKLAINENAGLFSIGGDHSITHTLISAFIENAKKPIILIQFDAHHDCGTDAVHNDRITHANFVRHLLAHEGVSAVVQLGLRGIRSVDQMYIHDKLIQVTGEKLEPNNIRKLLSDLHESYPDSVAYISFDMDCLDPGSFPHVDFPISGGPSFQIILQTLETVFQSGLNFFGGDLVEGHGVSLSERLPGHMELALRLMAYILEGLHRNRISMV